VNSSHDVRRLPDSTAAQRFYHRLRLTCIFEDGEDAHALLDEYLATLRFLDGMSMFVNAAIYVPLESAKGPVGFKVWTTRDAVAVYVFDSLYRQNSFAGSVLTLTLDYAQRLDDRFRLWQFRNANRGRSCFTVEEYASRAASVRQLLSVYSYLTFFRVRLTPPSHEKTED
jgi:hypothetical protein